MADIVDPSKYFARLPLLIQRAVQKDIPRKVANKVAQAFRQNFQTESFFGTPWKDVKRRTEPRASQVGKADSRRKILTGRTGNLGRSIKTEVRDGECAVISDLEYSAAHNEGTNTAGRGRNTSIPQRQFMGDHEQVDKIIRETITEAISKAFKP